MHTNLCKKTAAPLDQSRIKELAYARIVISNARLDKSLFEIGGPTFGARTLPVRPAYGVAKLLAQLRIKAMPGNRCVNVIVQRIAKLDFLPKMPICFGPGLQKTSDSNSWGM